jgi:hypothetical protein
VSSEAPLAPSSDVDASSLEHLEFRPSCTASVDKVECGKDASFSMRCRHCAMTTLLCAEHVAEVHRRARNSPRVGCTTCRVYAAELGDVVDIVPLGFRL